MLRKFTTAIIAFFIITITNAQPPVPGVIYVDFSWTPNAVDQSTTVTFTATVNGNTGPVQYRWDFGDGTQAVDPDTQLRHVYLSAGTYTVSLKAFAGYGDSSDAVIKTLVVSAPANNTVTANFTYGSSPIYENTAVQFIDNSSTTSGIITGYLWSLDGGNTFTATQNFTYTFNGYGQYEVTHKVNNSTGTQASITKLITVLPSHTLTQQVCAEESKFLYCYNQATSYQWQVSADSGASFQDIAEDNTSYSFTKTNSLLLNYTASSLYGSLYRCRADATIGTVYKVEIKNEFTGSIDNTWENPGNWSCGVLPDANTDVVISSGTVTLSSDASCRTLTVSPGAIFTISTGFTLTVAH